MPLRTLARLVAALKASNSDQDIVATLSALAGSVAKPASVLICYDHAEDDTLPAIHSAPQAGLPILFVDRCRPRGCASSRRRSTSQEGSRADAAI